MTWKPLTVSPWEHSVGKSRTIMCSLVSRTLKLICMPAKKSIDQMPSKCKRIIKLLLFFRNGKITTLKTQQKFLFSDVTNSVNYSLHLSRQRVCQVKASGPWPESGSSLAQHILIRLVSDENSHFEKMLRLSPSITIPHSRAKVTGNRKEFCSKKNFILNDMKWPTIVDWLSACQNVGKIAMQ